MRLLAAFATALLFSLPAPAAAQGQPAPLFASDEPIRLVIQGPLPSLFRDREQRDPVPGTVIEPSGQSLPVSLRLRGLTRRMSETCEFPPLRVDFPAAPSPGSLFAGQRRLKLVTHCRNSTAFQQYVLLEYAAYRMYNVLTPHSFRVRLATIDYRDAGGRPNMTRVGFFLEELSELATRSNLPVSRGPERIALANLNADAAARYGLFQHMLANHDWSMIAGPPGDECCHNAELIGPLTPGATIVVPYDFDFSGFVSTPYALPPDILRLSSVRQRKYRGFCAHNPAVTAAARQMRDARPKMLAALASTPGLDPRTQSRAVAFVEPFFAEIATDDGVANLLKRCAG